jgi:hypothetical protein
VHRFVFVERLLDEGVAIAAETDKRLVQLIGLIGVERELRLCELELRIVVGSTGAVLERGDAGLLGLDAVIQRVESLGDLERLPGERRSVLGGTAESAGECLIDLAIGQAQRILCILALLGNGCLHGELAGKAQRRLVHQAAGRRKGGWGIELKGRIAPGNQVLADKQRHKEQRQRAQDAKAAKGTESAEGVNEAGLGEIGHLEHVS